MNKFKVGDKVVPCPDEDYGGCHNYLVEGEVYTVTSTQYGLIDIDGAMSPLAVYGESCKFDWSEDWFELYEEKEKEMNAEQIRDKILRIDARIEEAKKDIENSEKERNSLVEKLREKGFELGGTSNQYIKLGDRVEITGWSKERHEKSHIGRKGIIEKIDNTDIPFKVILDDENEDSNTWFEANQVKKI